MNFKLPRLYLDLDGVQANFFGEWTKRHGVDHWKAIADIDKEFQYLENSSYRIVYDFFYDLDPLESGAQVIDWLSTRNIKYTVLSRPIDGPYRDASIQAKKSWLDKHYKGTSLTAIFTEHKQFLARDESNSRGAVLLDDFGRNISLWEKAGGIGIKFEDEYEIPAAADLAIKALEQIYGRASNSL